VQGIQGMLQTYIQALKATSMKGPTYFADILKRFT